MLDLKEERRYTRLRKLAQELHIPMPEAFLTLEVFDKDGKLIQRHHQRSHSWTRNAYNIMFCQLAGKDGDDVTFEAGKLSIKNTVGSVITKDHPVMVGWGKDSTPYLQSVDGVDAGYRAGGGDDTKGIVVGSGTNAESFEDYALQTPIPEGAGGGQLNHAASEAHAISYADTTLTNTLIRYLNNNSGGNVSVNEVGLITEGCYSTSAAGQLFLVARDKLPSTVTVPDTGQLKVTYTVQLTYAG